MPAGHHGRAGRVTGTTGTKPVPSSTERVSTPEGSSSVGSMPHTATMQAPTLAELKETARVVALPLVTRFRGVDVREAMLFEGPNGWTEFSPFVEYEDPEASVWLAAAIDFGWGGQRPPTATTCG